MNGPVETTKYKGLTIKIYQDENAQDPRKEWDNFGKMVCAHRRYLLGDEKMDAEDIKDLMARDDLLYLPLYLYDHGGITMRTGPFSCPWDSGMVGIIYATREMIFKEYGGRRLTKTLKKKVFALLEAEVKTYDQYLTGDIYGYVVEDANGEHLDSCWGFYGMEDCRAEAKSSADYYAKQKAKERADEARETALDAMPCVRAAAERFQMGAI